MRTVPLMPGSLKTSTWAIDRKSTRLNSSHTVISYAVFCLKKKKKIKPDEEKLEPIQSSFREGAADKDRVIGELRVGSGDADRIDGDDKVDEWGEVRVGAIK